MTVRELLTELQEMDPEAEVRFFHLRKVMKDGSGRVESYPVLDVSQGDDEITLSDFVCEGACLYKVRRADWEQPALKSREVADEDDAVSLWRPAVRRRRAALVTRGGLLPDCRTV